MKKGKRFLAFLLTVVVCLSVSACTPAPEPSGSSSSGGASNPPASSKEEPKNVNTKINPLTGLNDLPANCIGKRPVGIMINNIRSAVPQNNIAGADLCYEMLVEGGITRILAIYSDIQSLPKTGSIRSARPSYVELAKGHDLIYCHVGGSDEAASMIKSMGVDDVDGNYDTKTIWRDKGRVAEFGSVHSCVTDGERLMEKITKENIRTDIRAGANAFTFLENGKTRVPSGEACTSVTVPFSASYTSVFDYDEKAQVYKKSQFGAPHVDYGTNKQVAVTNVLVLKTKVENSHDAAGHMNIELEGGEGLYISMGGCEEIKWSKGNANNPLTLTNKDGTPLELNCGKSWICFVGLATQIDVESE